jgi:hypothetical protein
MAPHPPVAVVMHILCGFLGAYVVGYMRISSGHNFGGFIVLDVSLLIVAGIFAVFLHADERIASLAKKPVRSSDHFMPRPHTGGNL